MYLRELVEKLIEQLVMSNYVEKETGLEHEIKNNKAFIDLNEYLSKPQETDVTDEFMEKYVTKIKVESGWLYNIWDTEKDDYAENWVFVPDMQVRRT